MGGYVRDAGFEGEGPVLNNSDVNGSEASEGNGVG